MSDSTLDRRAFLRRSGAAAGAAVAGTVRLVRNHEQSPGQSHSFLGQTKPYNPVAGGGTTTIEYDLATGSSVTHPSLQGTVRNCAGGPTPWGSWLSCEETTDNVAGTQHGYVFDVPSSLDEPVDPVALTDMGVFSHEAVAVDPATGHVYETEDAGNTSGFYRFRPHTQGQLANGGTLEMLAIVGQPQYDTRGGQVVNRPLHVAWVPIADPNPAAVHGSVVFDQGRAAGGAAFARLESG